MNLPNKLTIFRVILIPFFVFFMLAPNMTVFYGIQIFQMLGWGLMAAASVYYVNSIMDAEDAIKGQAYITMTYLAV